MSARVLRERREPLLLAALVLATVLVWALAPTYPNYDTYFHLGWGRQLLHGMAPGFETYAAPTQHPLFVGIAALAALFGRAGERVVVLITLLSWVALVYGTFRIGRAVFGWVPGLVAAALVASSFAFLLDAAKAFVDTPFVALVVAAAALAADGPERRFAVMGVLTLAGLLRPEAWLLAGGWWLWCARARPRPPRRQVLGLAALAAAAPLGWALCDLLVTGDALYSLHATSALAGALGRLRGREQLPWDFVRFLSSAVRPPVALVAVAGIVLAWRRVGPRQLLVPLALLGFGALAFFGLGLAGQPVIPRYLTIPAVATCLFAGYAFAGWTGLGPADSTRRRWKRLSLVGVVLGLAFVVIALPKLTKPTKELAFVQRSHSQLDRLLRAPAVIAARRCGPITFPTYRLVPDTRWLLDVPDSAAVARTDPARRPGGPVVIVSGRKAVQRYGLAEGIPHSTNLHPRGWPVVARSGPFTAYAKGCAAVG